MKEKIKKLQIYIEKVRYAISNSEGPKKEFWERELRKHSAKLDNLTK